MSQVDFLLSLPSALSCEILCVWLCIPELARLDSAYCVRLKRLGLLALYKEPELLFRYCPEVPTLWMLEKKIKLVDFLACEEEPIDLLVAYLKECGSSIQCVHVEENVSPNVVHAVAAYCPHISVLNICQMNDMAVELAALLPHLERLNFSYVDVTNLSQPLSFELLHLRKLTIEWNRSLEDETAIRAIVAKCPELTHFSVMYGHSPFAQDSASLLCGLRKLTAVKLYSPLMDDASLTAIVNHCPLIEHLDLQGCKSISDAGICAVATKLHLKSIAFCSTMEITDQGLLHLHQCANTLRTLYIAQNAGMSIIGTNKLSLPAVTALLSATNLTSYEWRCDVIGRSFAVAKCSCATTIVLSAHIEDSTLRSIGEHCKRLQRLNIVIGTAEAVQYTSTGLYAVIHSCPLLKTIRVNEGMDEIRFGEILRLHKDVFVFASDNDTPLYDVMEM